jgi:uncharacterized FlgJ-related protein
LVVYLRRGVWFFIKGEGYDFYRGRVMQFMKNPARNLQSHDVITKPSPHFPAAEAQNSRKQIFLQIMNEEILSDL